MCKWFSSVMAEKMTFDPAGKIPGLQLWAEYGIMSKNMQYFG